MLCHASLGFLAKLFFFLYFFWKVEILTFFFERVEILTFVLYILIFLVNVYYFAINIPILFFKNRTLLSNFLCIYHCLLSLLFLFPFGTSCA
jgi:hypothetical protein